MNASRTLMRLGLIALAGASLAACGQRREQTAEAPPPAAGPPAPIEQTPAPLPTSAPLTPYGWGKITIDMAEAEAVAAGLSLPESAKAGPECHVLVSRAYPGLLAMVEDGKVSRISVRETTALKTDKGLGVGDTPEAVRAAYGDSLVSLPHKYAPAPAAYLTVWSLPNKRGVRYVIGDTGKVAEVHVGGPSIEYVEGCG